MTTYTFEQVRQFEAKSERKLSTFKEHDDWMIYSESFYQEIQSKLLILSRIDNLLKDLEILL